MARTKRPSGEAELNEITEVAILYHLEKITQEGIAERLGLSRMRVRRLLERGREAGVVQVRVRQGADSNPELERALITRFGLDQALIAGDYADPTRQRTAVARRVAKYLGRAVGDDQVIAVGMGRNVGAVAELSDTGDAVGCTFVCAIGGSLRGGQFMNADHICQRLADSFQGRSEVLYAPAQVEDPGARAALLACEPVATTLGHARQADHALVGIGDLSEDSNLVRLGWFSSQEIVAARVSGTIGDILGYEFVDIHGRRTNTPIQERIIGLRIEDLRAIDNVIAVASESTKAAAILGCLRTGVINTVATSAANALSILKLDDATRTRTPAPLVTYR